VNESNGLSASRDNEIKGQTGQLCDERIVQCGIRSWNVPGVENAMVIPPAMQKIPRMRDNVSPPSAILCDVLP
jgi:hypothetical protein